MAAKATGVAAIDDVRTLASQNEISTSPFAAFLTPHKAVED